MNPPFLAVFPSTVWDSILRGLAADRRMVAVGRWRRNALSEACELLAYQAHNLRHGLPRGADFSPLADWWVVVSGGGEEFNASHWLNRLQPHESQGLLVVELAIDEGREACRGFVFDRAKAVPLAAVRVVAPGMPQTFVDDATSADDPILPAHQAWRTRGAIGFDAWTLLSRAAVVILGCGRTGSAAAWQAAALGVRHVKLVDPDRVEWLNLDGMFGVSAADVGKLKVEAVARGLVALRPDLAVTAFSCAAEDARVDDLVRDADLIISAGDNGVPDLVAARASARYLKVHLALGTGVTASAGRRVVAGDARLLVGRGCVRCVGGVPDEPLARARMSGRPDEAPRPDAARLGSLITLNTMNVGMGLQLWLDLLGGRLSSSWWHRFEWVEGEGVRADHGPAVGDPACTTCGTATRETEGASDVDHRSD